MSLIQQALEKTNRVQETRTTNLPSDPKVYERDPMGAALEQELTQVQESYSKRRSLYRKAALGVLLVCFIGGLFYVAGIRRDGAQVSPSAAASGSVRTVSQSPLRIYSGNIFRLSGIMDLGDKPMAVINGNIVGVGDSLSGKAVVREIGKGEVRLDVQGKEIRLAL